MNITLNIQPDDEAEAMRTILADLRSALNFRVKRPNITAARIVASGKLLGFFDEIERQLPAPVTAESGADKSL